MATLLYSSKIAIASASPEAINSEELLIHFFNHSFVRLSVTPPKSGPTNLPPPIM